MSWLILIAVVALVIAIVFAVDVAEKAKERKLLDRPCAGIRWHRRFPVVPHYEIRRFLRMFTEAFSFDVSHACKFAPDDQPVEIYSARYIPGLTTDDHCEFEILEESLLWDYGIDLNTECRDEITSGELFAMTLSRKSSPQV